MEAKKPIHAEQKFKLESKLVEHVVATCAVRNRAELLEYLATNGYSIDAISTIGKKYIINAHKNKGE